MHQQIASRCLVNRFSRLKYFPEPVLISLPLMVKNIFIKTVQVYPIFARLTFKYLNNFHQQS